MDPVRTLALVEVTLQLALCLWLKLFQVPLLISLMTLQFAGGVDPLVTLFPILGRGITYVLAAVSFLTVESLRFAFLFHYLCEGASTAVFTTLTSALVSGLLWSQAFLGILWNSFWKKPRKANMERPTTAAQSAEFSKL
jgi:hypothetical protein